MNRSSPKSWSKGFMTLLAITVVLVVLFALFGRSPGYGAQYGVMSHGWGASDASTQGVNKTSATSGIVFSEGAAPAMPAPSAAPAATPEATPGAMGAPSKSTGNYAGDGGAGGMSSADTSNVSTISGQDASLTESRKIINEGRVQIETKDFDNSIAAIDQMIAQSGGFAEMRNVQGSSINSSNLRYATITFRVPADQFDAVMNNMSTIGTVTQKNTNGTDITDQYIDNEARLKTLKVQEQTLTDIMAKAQKLEEVITLESRISEVQYEIESIENKLKNYDRLIQYSRISMSINEVIEVTEAKPVARTLGDKIAEAFNEAVKVFTNGLENFTLWLVANWILFAFFIALLIVFIIIRSIYRIGKRKKAKNLPEKKEGGSGVN